MDEKRNGEAFAPRQITHEEMMIAARWWAANATTMTPVDPWKSHAAIIPLMALIAPTPGHLVAWLDTANKAVGAPQGNIYASALTELMSSNPPWAPGNPFSVVHSEKWSIDMRILEMQRLLDEVRQDSAIQIGKAPALFSLKQ